jgi:hypothetical protein
MAGLDWAAMVETRARRCYLVYAVAPEGTSAREANDRLNEYIDDQSRGLVVFHDHFTGGAHGGIAVFDVANEEERARLDDAGPLAGWSLGVHGLTFALTAVGFAEQLELTLEGYRGATLDELRASEEPDPRFWWQRRRSG